MEELEDYKTQILDALKVISNNTNELYNHLGKNTTQLNEANWKQLLEEVDRIKKSSTLLSAIYSNS